MARLEGLVAMNSKLIARLQSPDAETRYNAIVALARMPAHDDWKLAWDAIDAMLNVGEPDRNVGSTAAIALSMISARNCPFGDFYSIGVPDFLADTYARARVGLCPQPSPQDFERLDQMAADLPPIDEGEDDPAS